MPTDDQETGQSSTTSSPRWWRRVFRRLCTVAHMWAPSFLPSYFFSFLEHRLPSLEGKFKRILCSNNHSSVILNKGAFQPIYPILSEWDRHLCSIDKPFRYKYQMIVAWNLLTLFFPQKFMLGILQWSMNMIQGPCHMEMKWLSPIIPNYCRKERHLVTDFKVLTLCCALWCRIQIAKWNSW